MEPAVYVCRSPECDTAGRIWDVERDDRGRAVDGPAAKLCPGCGRPGHRLSDRERAEAGV